MKKLIISLAVLAAALILIGTIVDKINEHVLGADYTYVPTLGAMITATMIYTMWMLSRTLRRTGPQFRGISLGVATWAATQQLFDFLKHGGTDMSVFDSVWMFNPPIGLVLGVVAYIMAGRLLTKYGKVNPLAAH